MFNLTDPNIQIGKNIVERKIRYDSTIVDTNCKLLNNNEQGLILFHRIDVPFTMTGSQYELTIPKDAYTLAYFWREQPYNLYVWRDKDGSYLGSYFNIVKNTTITDDTVSFEDLIIDILIFPNGKYFILDEDELPMALNEFEDGFVQQALQALINSIKPLLKEILLESERRFSHKDMLSTLYHN
ncbi:DUF402 domain-containing protein [Priestia megaterium]|uniref:DUF402 domain-containing protein n=1 Tax=Priestia megaterium TaxID=1404 RepID=UPI000BF64573|nr:DUF402 domain-containing protein [Priestia megaterium]PFV93185.1 DUF402 domain-containing protein [Priestia megaterium]